MAEENSVANVIDFLRSGWFLIVFIGGLIYWAAKHDSSLSIVQKDQERIVALEKKTNALDSGIGQLKLKIDGIQEDLSLIKSAVIK